MLSEIVSRCKLEHLNRRFSFTLVLQLVLLIKISQCDFTVSSRILLYENHHLLNPHPALETSLSRLS